VLRIATRVSVLALVAFGFVVLSSFALSVAAKYLRSDQSSD
jgi:hypothetical protein